MLSRLVFPWLGQSVLYFLWIGFDLKSVFVIYGDSESWEQISPTENCPGLLIVISMMSAGGWNSEVLGLSTAVELKNSEAPRVYVIQYYPSRQNLWEYRGSSSACINTSGCWLLPVFPTHFLCPQLTQMIKSEMCQEVRNCPAYWLQSWVWPAEATDKQRRKPVTLKTEMYSRYLCNTDPAQHRPEEKEATVHWPPHACKSPIFKDLIFLSLTWFLPTHLQ